MTSLYSYGSQGAPGSNTSQPFSGLVWGNGKSGTTHINEYGQEQFYPGDNTGNSQFQQFSAASDAKPSGGMQHGSWPAVQQQMGPTNGQTQSPQSGSAGLGAVKIDGNNNYYFEPGSAAVSSSPYAGNIGIHPKGSGTPIMDVANQAEPYQTGGSDPKYTPGQQPSNFGIGSGTGASPTDGNQNLYQTGGPDYRPASGPGSNNHGSTGGLFGFGQNITPPPNLSNGAPDYMGWANYQSQYNQRNAQQQGQMNNPNYYGPGGSQTRTQNPDGSWSVTQTLSPELQAAYSQQNQLKSQLLGRAGQLAGRGELNYNGIAPSANYNTSGVSGIPNADAADLEKMRDSVYQQQTQYLDPQFQQAQSDMESKLANQGIMPGSEAYNREMDNFARTKQKAYGDARNAAIQAGGAEQSRLFGLGLQSHTTGMNDALQGFQAGMAGRQQGVSEANALHNAPINDINALNGVSNTTQLPTYPGQNITSTPGVDFMYAAKLQDEANRGIANANSASSQNTLNGLYGLGSAFMQSPAGQNLLNNVFGGNQQAFSQWLSNNEGVLNSTGMTPAELLGSF